MATCPIAVAQDQAHHHGMKMDAGGMVMNENRDRLPRGCPEISGDVAIEVEAAVEHAAGRPGQVFGYSRSRFEVAPCSRVTVTFHNRDQVRHQWMVHGLPRYLYSGGMFHIEAAGGVTRAGTFIVPAEDATYLVHCDVAQHMEKGMKAQLRVGAGAGDLWAVPKLSEPFNRASYLPARLPGWLLSAFLAGAGLGLLLTRRG